MVCCGCSPLAVSTIYEKIDQLAEKGVVCPYACACAQGRLLKCASDTPAQRLIERAPHRAGAAAGCRYPPLPARVLEPV